MAANDFATSMGTEAGRRFKRGAWAVEEIMEEGRVTMSAFVNPGLYKKRQAISAKKKDHERMDTIVGDSTCIDIEPCEVVFFEANQPLRGGDFRGGGSRGLGVFSSFTGVELNGAQTDVELSLQYRVAGIANAQYHFSDPGQTTKSRVAVKVAGSATVGHTGHHAIHPGDVVVAELPRINKEDREKQKASSAHFNGVPRNKLLAFLKSYDFRDVNHLEQLAVDLLLGDVDGAQTDLDLLIHESNTHYLFPETETALQIKRETLYNVLVTLITADQYGIVTLNTPSVDRPTAPAYYNAFEDVLNLSLNDVNEKVVSVTVNEDGSNDLEFLPDVNVDKNQRAMKYTWLAYKLGLVKPKSASESHLVENTNLTSAFIGRNNYGWVAHPEDRNTFTIAHVFPSTMPSRKRTVDGTTVFNENTISGRLAKHESSARNGLSEAIGLARDHARSYFVGRATNRALPGESLDLVL